MSAASLRLAHRAAADAGRRAAAAVGARPTTVLSPAPRVRSGGGAASYFGGGTAAASAGVLLAGQYLVGPITLDYAGGGYTQAQLCPAAGEDRAVYYLLEGDEFSSGGERFRLVDADATRPHQITLVVERTAQ